MSGPSSANRESLAAALIGPRRPPLAAARGIPCAPLERYSLDSYVRARSAPDRVVLCPQGRNLDADLAFLEAVKRRLLWPPPPPDIAGAIAGLVTETAAAAAPASATSPSRRKPGPRAQGPLHAALLLEGLVTRERADRALESPIRLWIVESVRCISLQEADLEDLAWKGVHWAALRPIELAGLVVSGALARARARWPRSMRSRPAWRAAPRAD
jgi:hypothetical protein